MTELIRPALYNSYHKIENITSAYSETDYYTVVCPICESSETFASNLKLPITKRNDILSVRSVGAYGQGMTLKYNLRRIAKTYYKNTLTFTH